MAALAARVTATLSALSFITGPGALTARATARAMGRAATSATTALTGSARVATRGFGALVGPGSLTARAFARASAGASIAASTALAATGHAASRSASSFALSISIIGRGMARLRGAGSPNKSTALLARAYAKASGRGGSSGIVGIAARAFSRLRALARVSVPSTDLLINPNWLLRPAARVRAVIAAKRVRHIIAGSNSMDKFSPKTPDEKVVLSIDFAKIIPNGATISSMDVTASVHPKSKAADSDPTAILSGSPTKTGTVISQMVLGGVANADYVVGFAATLSDGEKIVAEGLLPVREPLP
jgi:hypothetical protein